MDCFAEMCEAVASHNSRLRKIAILSEYLKALSDADLFLAVRFLSSGPLAEDRQEMSLFPVKEAVKLSIGYSTLRQALQAACGWDTTILRICHSEVGDTGETAALLMRGIAEEQPLTLAGANALYQSLFQARTTASKLDILVRTLQRCRPLTTKYFIKVITRGLRIGLMERMVEEAVARACDVPHTAVRDANNRLGDLAYVALAARHRELAAIEATLFHPMDFMLAKPLERLEDLGAAADWIAEDKYDGIRSQVHFDSGRVQIFSRGMEDVTYSFPEIVAAFKTIAGNGVVDGEIVAWRDGRILNFNRLRQRLARKRLRTSLLEEIPVAFIAYDLLLRNGSLLLACGLEERRAALENMFGPLPPPLLLSAQRSIVDLEAIDNLFTDARTRGNEGLLLKRKGAVYEPGRRSGAWYKLKRPYGTLDVVITAAEQGEGRRAIYLSDYTFAVRSGEQYVNVGKAYSGLTDAEVKELTRVLRSASVERFGRVVLVKPEVVLEVAFDGVQKSARHKSGYALRFPRILRWRKDKKPQESDDLARVEALYEASLQ